MEGGSYPNLELFISDHYHCILWVFIKIKETLHETEGHWFSFRKALPGEPSNSLIPFKGGHHELSIFTSSKINDIGPFLLRQIQKEIANDIKKKVLIQFNITDISIPKTIF